LSYYIDPFSGAAQMSLFNKLVFLLIFLGFYGSLNAAVQSAGFSACSTVFSDAEQGKGDEKDGKGKEEEEPDCE
jgi:hypothetical protein